MSLGILWSSLEVSQGHGGRAGLPGELDLLAQLLEDGAPGEAPRPLAAPGGAGVGAGPALQRHTGGVLLQDTPPAEGAPLGLAASGSTPLLPTSQPAHPERKLGIN